MSTNKDYIFRYIDEIVSDPTYRLDVIYWKDFAIDFNKNAQFQTIPLGSIGELRSETVEQQLMVKEVYYTFKITYGGSIVLKEPKDIKNIDITKFKVAKKGDIVFSRINCCRGAIGIVKEFQNDSICTNETHIFTVTHPEVDVRYLHIILRHPYYQDRILSQSTGASLERMRFPDIALLSFEVPIPPYETQLELINQIKRHDEVIKNNYEKIEQLRIERNYYVMKELGIDLVFIKGNEDFYGLPISNVVSNSAYRLDFEHNKPSFDLMINKLNQCKYPFVTIGDILSKLIKSGSTPNGGIYPIKGIIFLKAGNIIENGIDLSDHEFISTEFHESLKRSQLKGNEVLVTIAGTIGRVGVNNEIMEGNINQAIAIVRLNNEMLPLFLSAFLNSDGGQVQFSKYRHDFGTPNINTTELAKLRVPLPPLPIQKKIVEEIIEFEKKISIARDNSNQSKQLKSEIITEFLIGKKKYKNILERLK